MATSIVFLCSTLLRHAVAPSVAATDWERIVLLYDVLGRIAPSPVVELNRAVAVAEWRGAEEGLAALGPIGSVLDRYHLFHAARGELLARLGRIGDASDATRTALALTENVAERRLLADRLAALDARGACQAAR